MPHAAPGHPMRMNVFRGDGRIARPEREPPLNTDSTEGSNRCGVLIYMIVRSSSQEPMVT